MSEELKACPFCGEEARQFYICGNLRTECSSLDCRVLSIDNAQWNTRTIEDALEEKIELRDHGLMIKEIALSEVRECLKNNVETIDSLRAERNKLKIDNEELQDSLTEKQLKLGVDKYRLLVKERGDIIDSRNGKIRTLRAELTKANETIKQLRGD